MRPASCHGTKTGTGNGRKDVSLGSWVKPRNLSCQQWRLMPWICIGQQRSRVLVEHVANAESRRYFFFVFSFSFFLFRLIRAAKRVQLL